MVHYQNSYGTHPHRREDAPRPSLVELLGSCVPAGPIAFAMLISQHSYVPEKWSALVAAGKTAMAKTKRSTKTT
jgi:hypothetical protein